MALSNWDTLAFGPDGKPSNGKLTGFDGQSVEIYKNWLYVKDAKMFTEKRGFINETIALIESGNVTIANFDIKATRGPQNAIFAYVETTNYHVENDKHETKRMAGIGCYGYDSPEERVAEDLGINLDNWKNYMLSYTCGDEEEVIINLWKDDNFARKPKEYKLPMKERYEAQWIGVTNETYKQFMDWLKNADFRDDFQKWFQSLSNPQRVNQGDAYFANHFMEDFPSTKIGESKTPILENLLNEQ